jgi:hypothetical protein
VGPLGCIPNQRASSTGPPERCVDQVNQIVDTFNRGLSSLVNQLNTDHPDSRFLYGNTYDALFDIINSPTKYGTLVTKYNNFLFFVLSLFLVSIPEHAQLSYC